MLEGIEAQESWLIFKSDSPLTSEIIHAGKEDFGPKHQEACIYEQGNPGKTQTMRKPIENGNRDR